MKKVSPPRLTKKNVIRCQKKKLTAISRSDDNVTFYFDDFSTLKYTISGTSDRTFLNCLEGHNAEVFYQLGINNPHKFYKEVGVYLDEQGDCPECRREDLDKVFNYLLKHYSVEPEEEPKKEPSEWDWLLN